MNYYSIIMRETIAHFGSQYFSFDSHARVEFRWHCSTSKTHFLHDLFNHFTQLIYVVSFDITHTDK